VPAFKAEPALDTSPVPHRVNQQLRAADVIRLCACNGSDSDLSRTKILKWSSQCRVILRRKQGD
jgi:hypothetical protein